MIDIIIPVYNTPIKDLQKCLNSVANQTFDKYKVYIIDDGSNGETKIYLDRYVTDKENFIVHHIENGGVSKARNYGLDISKNKYITFVDSDDTLEPNFLKEAYNIITTNNLDIIIGGYHEVKNNIITRTRISKPGLHIYEGYNLIYFFEKLLSSKTNDTNKELGDCPTGRIYTRLFKRESLKNLRFNTNIHMSEDTLFMIEYMACVTKIGVVDKVWYNYFINEYSISNGTKKEKLIKNIEGFINEIIKRKKEEKNEIIKNAYQARINKANDYIEELKKSN